VVPNVDLMDNHQGQLASELEKGGYLVVSDIPYVPSQHRSSSLTSSTLKENLTRFIDGKGKGIKAFPEREPERFRGIMDEMMGFKEDKL